MKSGYQNVWSSCIVLAAALIAVAFLIHYRAVPPAMPFSPFDVHLILNVLGGLFVVALMTERAVEVVISVLRDADLQVLLSAIDASTADLAAARAAAAPPEVIGLLTDKLSARKGDLEAYKVDTRETTYCISFLLGVALAVVGVRGLLGLLGPAPGPVSGWFRLVDILVTGAVIAGGSDGIHQMVKAVLDCFSTVSATMAKKSGNAS